MTCGNPKGKLELSFMPKESSSWKTMKSLCRFTSDLSKESLILQTYLLMSQERSYKAQKWLTLSGKQMLKEFSQN